MNRYALVLAAVTAVLVSGCGSDPAAQPVGTRAALPTDKAASLPPARAGAPAKPVVAPASSAPVKRSTGRPANALSWAQPDLSGEDLDRAVRITWADKHGVDPARVRGDQLLMGLADNGGLMVGAYQLWAPGGKAHVVVAQSEPASEPSLIIDELARPDLPAVAAVASRRTAEVVAAVAPGTTKVEYRARSGAAWTVIEQDSLDLVFPRSSSPGEGEALRTTRGGVTEITPLRARAATAQLYAAPANVVTWPGRGRVADGPSTDVVAKAYAKERRAKTAKVKRLYSGSTDSGVRFLVGQAWVEGEQAVTVGYIVRPSQEGELVIQPATPRGTRVIGLLVTALPGTTTDLLVVVPEPRTTQVSYRASGGARWQPAYTDRMLDGVNLIDRSKNPADDSLQVMTGNGDPNAASTLVIRVSKVLCSGISCS